MTDGWVRPIFCEDKDQNTSTMFLYQFTPLELVSDCRQQVAVQSERR